MTAEDAPRWAVGETALLITVPEADALVGGARTMYDPAAGAGVPAHVTVLHPFLPAGRIDAETLAALREVFARHDPFELSFGRFPGLLWPAPEPEGPVRALTSAVAARRPEAPPYGGAFDDPAPHPTVADGQSEETYEAVEREFGPGLPLRAQVTGVHPMSCDSDRWRLRQTFPLGGGPDGTGTAAGATASTGATGSVSGSAAGSAAGSAVRVTGGTTAERVALPRRPARNAEPPE